jgi:hypothetical protein
LPTQPKIPIKPRKANTIPTILIALELPEFPLLAVACTTGTFSTIDDVYVVTCPFDADDVNTVNVVTR